jgi:pimeloyl-ACP methyl ester carboxylesterase
MRFCQRSNGAAARNSRQGRPQWAWATRLQRARLDSRSLKTFDSIDVTLPQVKTSVSAISGLDDPVMGTYAASQRKALARLAPAACLDLIDGAGHWVMYECAERFNTLFSRRLMESVTNFEARTP